MTLLRERLAVAVDTRPHEDKRLRAFKKRADNSRRVTRYDEGKAWVYDMSPDVLTDPTPVNLSQG